MYAVLTGATFLLPVELQVVWGYSPLASGLALLPLTVIMLALSARSGRLATRIGPRLQMSAARWWSARAWPCSRSAPTGPAMWSTYCRRSLLHSMPRPGRWQHYVRNHSAPRAFRSGRTPAPAWISQFASPPPAHRCAVRVLDVCPR